MGTDKYNSANIKTESDPMEKPVVGVGRDFSLPFPVAAICRSQKSFPEGYRILMNKMHRGMGDCSEEPVACANGEGRESQFHLIPAPYISHWYMEYFVHDGSSALQVMSGQKGRSFGKQK